MTFDTFIAANTFKGFSSYFDELIRDINNKKVYLIKGGPGCGKNTFMKKICEQFDDNGCEIEKIFCSSDPKSLDGIKIHDNNTVIIDATPPHSFDMKYPGFIDNIIDLSLFWDTDKLTSNKENIKKLFDAISEKYKSVYSSLRSSGILILRQQTESENNCDKNKIINFVKKHIKRSAFIQTDKEPNVYNRYLSSIGFNGVVTKTNAIKTLCQHGIIITDEVGLSSYIISKFVSYFKKTGNDIYLFHNPICPEQKIDHIIIPELKFGIFTDNSIFKLNYEADFKNINTKIFLNKDYISENKNKINLRKKLVTQLIESCTKEMSEIKIMHDELEKFYIESMDYDSLDRYTINFINKISNC